MFSVIFSSQKRKNFHFTLHPVPALASFLSFLSSHSLPHLSRSQFHPSFLSLSLKNLSITFDSPLYLFHTPYTICQQNPFISLFKMRLESGYFSPSPLPPCWSEPLASLIWTVAVTSSLVPLVAATLLWLLPSSLS